MKGPQMRRSRCCVNCHVSAMGFLCGDCWRVALIAAVASWLVTTVLNAMVRL